MTGGERKEGYGLRAALGVDDTAFWFSAKAEENHDSTDELTQLQTRHNSV